MNSKRLAYGVIGLVMGIVLLAMPSTLFAREGDSDVRVFPPELVVYGMTYGDWAAAFWQWETSLPLSSNPAVTGTNCLIGQQSGPVFFVPVSLGGPVTATCTVPANKAIFLTVLTSECSTIEGPPFNGSNPQELRQCNGAVTDPLDPNTLTLTVDDKPVVRDLPRFRVQTPSFEFIMPAADNLFNKPGMTSATSELDGYFVMLKPLPKGKHVIHFGGAFTSGPAVGFSADTTLNLTVE
jgi:hypothetical protein